MLVLEISFFDANFVVLLSDVLSFQDRQLSLQESNKLTVSAICHMYTVITSVFLVFR